MTPLAKQLRTSLLITLGLMSFTALSHLLDALLWGNFLAALGDQAVGLISVCALVAIVHTIIYGAMRAGRPETRGVRGVRAGLVMLFVLDVLPLLAAGYDVVASVPVLTVVVSWGRARFRGLGADIAEGRALVFGILSVLLQVVVAVVITVAG
ncbi:MULTISPECIES: hypothetical protein [unclassified Streptomyces]|uniref:hypothetical protein n=1 Tax=unclassified Streptomyces TaxID=2593676 RepID=UPI00341292CC